MRRREFLHSSVGVVGTGTALRRSVPGPTNDRPQDARSPRTGSPQDDDLEPLARVEIESAHEAVTDEAGETAFVAAGDGFAVVDCSEPSEPAVTTTVAPVPDDGDSATMTDVWDVSYDDGRLLVGGPATFYDEAAFNGLALYDVSDPTAPTLEATHETATSVHNCDLDGDVAYHTGKGLNVVDFGADPPELVATWSPLDHDTGWGDVPQAVRSLHDVTVADGRAYLANWDAGTFVLDVTDPADPSVLGRAGRRSLSELQSASGDRLARVAETPGNAHYVQPDDSGDLLAVGKEAWDATEGDGHGGPAGIDLWDVGDLDSPEHLARIHPPRPPADRDLWTTAHNFDLREGSLFASWYAGGVTVHDVSDPAAPRLLGHWRDDRRTSFWTARSAVPGEFFVASSATDDRAGADSALYVFPDRPLDEWEPNGTAIPPPPTETVAPTATPLPVESGSPTPTPGDRTVTTPTPTNPETATDATDGSAGTSTVSEDPAAGTSSDGGPGFGPLAALGAVGVAAWRSLRRGD